MRHLSASLHAHPLRRLGLAGMAVLGLASPLSLIADGASLLNDWRGPIANAGMKVEVSPEGVQAIDYAFTPPTAPEAWSAQWINEGGSGVPHSQVRLMRKEVTLDEAPRQVRAWITSNDYRLYVNGRLAARGPSNFGSDVMGGGPNSKLWFYDFRDLTSFFHAGKNVIAVEVFSGGFLFQAEMAGEKGKTTVVSDASWRGMSSGLITWLPISPEDKVAKGECLVYDENQEPAGWRAPEFDDAAWPACRVGGAPSETLTLSEIPPCMEAFYPMQKITRVEGAVQVPDQPLRPGHPIVVTGDGGFAVHFDRVMAGRYGFAIKGAKGARIYLSASETDTPGGRIEEAVLRDGLQYFESSGYYSIGTINVAVRNVTAPVEIEEVTADFTSQPVSYAGSFTCSDELLNQIWKDCRWSVQICLQTYHLDSPTHQEPIGDYGDYLIEDLVGYAAFGNAQWLARQDLRKWAAVMRNKEYATFHTSYTLLWLQSLVNYYDATGDLALIKELAPTADALLDKFATYVGKNGLISEAPNYMFMDWVTIEGFECHHPPAVIGQGYLSAFYYRGLADGIHLAELTGNNARKAQYAGLRTKLADAYNQELWNEGKGLYRDGKPFQTSVKPNDWLPADKQIETFSAQNNALAVLYDLAPADRQQAVIAKAMATKPRNVRPYFMHFVISALAHAGLFDEQGFQALRGWKIFPDTQTAREMGEHDGDYSHGWIATPVYQMSAHILGIAPTGPGYETFAIRPMLGDLAFAKGQVPTPHGLVKVDWRWQEEGELALNVTVPPGTRAALAFPLGTESGYPALALNHRPLWDGTKKFPPVDGITGLNRVGATVEMTLDPGDYQLVGTGLVSPEKAKSAP
jgi:alpha-L-rhamnosidase